MDDHAMITEQKVAEGSKAGAAKTIPASQAMITPIPQSEEPMIRAEKSTKTMITSKKRPNLAL